MKVLDVIREAFEQVWLIDHPDISFVQELDERYANPMLETCWEMFKAGWLMREMFEDTLGWKEIFD